MAPAALAVGAPQRVPDEKLLPSITVDVGSKRIMARLPFSLPKKPQIFIEDPEAAIAILHEDLARRAGTAQVDEQQRVADVQLVRAVLHVARNGWKPGGPLNPSGRAVEHLQLEVARGDDLGAAVAVEIVDLKRRVVGEEPVLWIRTSLLPQHTTVERDRREAANLIEGVAADFGDLLREEHVETAVAVEVPEADVAASAETRRLEFLPQPRARIIGAQLFEIALAPLDALTQLGCRRSGGGHPEAAKPRRHIGGDTRDAGRQLRIAYVQ
jgi:hypothetical protein